MAGAKNGAAAALDRLFAALGRGDVDAAVACIAPDGRVWHGFDGVAHDREGIARDWASFVAAFPERRFVDVRQQDTAAGCVRQHLMVGRFADGRSKAWPACIVASAAADGLIARLDEYIDRAGAFAWTDDGPDRTPGLA